MPSLEPRKSERSLAQSLTALNSSPRCTPCLKNAPLQSSCFKVLPEVPRATPLGPCAGHALSTHGQLERRSLHRGHSMFVYGQHLCGVPCTLPVKRAPDLMCVKHLGQRQDSLQSGQRMEAGRGRTALCLDCGGVT